MIKLLILSISQSLLLTASQIFLKQAMMKMGKFCWSRSFFSDLLLNIPLALSGITIVCASCLWFYILRNFAFSVAYPLISLSYVFGMLAAVFIFHEVVPLSRWIGVGLIIGGVFFILK